jgi:protease I
VLTYMLNGKFSPFAPILTRALPGRTLRKALTRQLFWIPCNLQSFQRNLHGKSQCHSVDFPCRFYGTGPARKRQRTLLNEGRRKRSRRILSDPSGNENKLRQKTVKNTHALKPEKNFMSSNLKDLSLNGKNIAILVANGFEEEELTSPRQALEEAGAKTEVVSPERGKVKGWKHTDWGKEVKVDVPLDSADAGDYDALLLPGGVMNPDHLRRNEKALDFVRSFFRDGKPVGAICHGPWTLIDAGVVRGRHLTSYESIQTDLKNAGAHWEDKEVIVENGLVTSRKPDDLPAFNRKLIDAVGAGVHEVQGTQDN